MIVGVLADTQKPLTDRERSALSCFFRGASLILHAGGVGSLVVLEQLSEIAKTVAVTGNQEEGWIKDQVRQKEFLQIGTLRIGLVHGYGKPHGLKARLLREFEDTGGVDLLVYARNFEPCARSLSGTYFFNPGSFSGSLPEGRKGRDIPRAGILYVEGRKIEGNPGVPVFSSA